MNTRSKKTINTPLGTQYVEQQHGRGLIVMLVCMTRWVCDEHVSRVPVELYSCLHSTPLVVTTTALGVN